jgi:cobalamin biosynthesis Mg chelatase CobN
MSETGLPTYLTRQFALTKPQLATELGAELLSLCQSVTADGRLAAEEIAGLRHWLADAEAAEMPAARYLRAVIERALADGRITADEYQEVYRALEAVLPFEARQRAHAAREQAEAAAHAATSVQSGGEGQCIVDDGWTRVADATFMVAGVRQAGRPALIEQQATSGATVILERVAAGSGAESIAVRLASGSQVGFVPEIDAQRLGPLLEQGCRCEARITHVRRTGRHPIPVVHVALFATDVAGNRARPATEETPGDVRRGTARKFAIAVGVLAVLLLLVAIYWR